MESSTSESLQTMNSEASSASSSSNSLRHDVNLKDNTEDRLKCRQVDIEYSKKLNVNEIHEDSSVNLAKLSGQKFVNLKIPQKLENINENTKESEAQQDIILTKHKDEYNQVGHCANNDIVIGETNGLCLEEEKKAISSKMPLSLLSKGSNLKGILRLKRDSVTGKLTLIQHNPSEDELKKITEKIKIGSSGAPEMKVHSDNDLKTVNIVPSVQTEAHSKCLESPKTVAKSEIYESKVNPKLNFVEINDNEIECEKTIFFPKFKEPHLVTTDLSEADRISENYTVKEPLELDEYVIDKSINHVQQNFEKINSNLNINHQPPKRKRGRPRKLLKVEPEAIDIQTSKFPTKCPKNKESHVLNNYNYHVNEAYNDTAENIEPPKDNTSIVGTSMVGCNDNFEPVKDFVAARARVRDIYKKWRKKYEVVEGKPKIPAYKLAAAKQAKRQVLIRQTQKHSVFRTWDSVLACRDRVEEEHRTKFLQTSQTRDHKMDRPRPGKNVLFQLTRTKGASATVPYNGIPFMWIGHVTYRCHLSGDRPSAKKRKDMLTFSGSRQRKFSNSKKLGCPAVFTVTKVARFPDFEVSDESHCATTVAQQLREAWAHHPSKCRFYLEFHVRRPSLEDHQFHDQAQSVLGLGKFQEPVDPRLLKRIHELTYDGVIGAKAMREYINDFVSNVLFKDQEAPDPGRRRYNPTNTDIRNAMKKARLQMRLDGVSAMQVACKGVMRELSSAISETSNEEYLNNLREHLTHLTSTVKDGHSLQPFLQAHPPKPEVPDKAVVPGAKRLGIKTESEGLETPQTVRAIVQYPQHIPTQAETDQATQILYHYNDQNDQQQCENQYEETVTEVYYYP